MRPRSGHSLLKIDQFVSLFLGRFKCWLRRPELYDARILKGCQQSHPAQFASLFHPILVNVPAQWRPLAAAEAGDEPRVASLLQSQADVNARDERGWSPLIMAAKEGHTSLLRLLLAAGAAPSAPDGVSHTALRGAALFGHAECISLLVEAGAAVNQSSERGKTPLMGAAMNGHAAALELLLRHRRCVQSRAMARPKRLIGPGERL